MENQNVILEKGAIDRIVEAMNRHSEDGPVQSKACSAFTNFASYDSPLKRERMGRGGGGAVVISMIMHPEDVDLQEKALRALRNICANSDENKIEVASVGGVDAVISAMQVHRDEPLCPRSRCVDAVKSGSQSRHQDIHRGQRGH